MAARRRPAPEDPPGRGPAEVDKAMADGTPNLKDGSIALAVKLHWALRVGVALEFIGHGLAGFWLTRNALLAVCASHLSNVTAPALIIRSWSYSRRCPPMS